MSVRSEEIGSDVYHNVGAVRQAAQAVLLTLVVSCVGSTPAGGIHNFEDYVFEDEI